MRKRDLIRLLDKFADNAEIRLYTDKGGFAPPLAGVCHNNLSVYLIGAMDNSGSCVTFGLSAYSTTDDVDCPPVLADGSLAKGLVEVEVA